MQYTILVMCESYNTITAKSINYPGSHARLTLCVDFNLIPNDVTNIISATM